MMMIDIFVNDNVMLIYSCNLMYVFECASL